LAASARAMRNDGELALDGEQTLSNSTTSSSAE